MKRLWKENTQPENSIEWGREEKVFRSARYFDYFFDLETYDFKRSWFDKLPLRRKTISSLNRLRCGHSSLRASLFRFLSGLPRLFVLRRNRNIWARFLVLPQVWETTVNHAMLSGQNLWCYPFSSGILITNPVSGSGVYIRKIPMFYPDTHLIPGFTMAEKSLREAIPTIFVGRFY